MMQLQQELNNADFSNINPQEYAEVNNSEMYEEENDIEDQNNSNYYED